MAPYNQVCLREENTILIIVSFLSYHGIDGKMAFGCAFFEVNGLSGSNRPPLSVGRFNLRIIHSFLIMDTLTGFIPYILTFFFFTNFTHSLRNYLFISTFTSKNGCLWCNKGFASNNILTFLSNMKMFGLEFESEKPFVRVLLCDVCH